MTFKTSIGETLEDHVERDKGTTFGGGQRERDPHAGHARDGAGEGPRVYEGGRVRNM